MGRCAYCGEEDYLLFKCSVCGQYYCAKHRVPETHGCNKKADRQFFRPSSKSYQKSSEYYIRSQYLHKKGTSSRIIALLILVGIAGFIYLQYKPSTSDIQDLATNLSSSVNESIQSLKTGLNETKEQAQETIEDILPEPPTQETILQYALDEINRERTKHGVANVTLSPIQCGQTHAENLLELECLSHWDAEGMKPYMRYTLAGGKGVVGENCAWMQSTGYVEPFEAIEKLTWGMIYDDAESNWGHRDNLLDPDHNRVSIGVAYDYSNLFLVQDFEDYYFESAEIISDGTVYEMRYTLSGDWSPEQIAIFYDPLPVTLSVDQLSNPPYDHGYDAGEWVGGIIAGRGRFDEGVTIRAEKWTLSGNTFHTRFDLNTAFTRHGEGVYSLLIWDSDRYYTTYSIWYEP